MTPDEALLARMAKFKGARRPAPISLGAEILGVFKHDVKKRHDRLGPVADAWVRLVPEFLNEHATLEAFTRGTLSVTVDSAPHLYELRQLLLAGIEQQLLLACRKHGLRKIALKRGGNG